MAERVNVSFHDSRIAALRQLPACIPQFFDDGAQPYRSLNLYLRKRAAWWSSNTLNTKTQHFSEFLTWLENSECILEYLTVRDLEIFSDALCIYRKNGKGLAWNTINSRVSAIYSFFIWGSENGFFQAFRASQNEKFRTELKQKFRALTTQGKAINSPPPLVPLDDAIRFINAFKHLNTPKPSPQASRNQLIAALMLEVGLRVTEVISFPLVDLPEINTRGHATAARVVGKGNKVRMVLIPNRLLATIWEYVEFDRATILSKLQTQKISVSTTVFIQKSGAPLTRNWIEKLFSKNSKRCGIKIYPHLLRHVFGTYHYLRNKDLATLTKLMGHTSEETTREFYVHTSNLVAQANNYRGLQERIDLIMEISID